MPPARTGRTVISRVVERPRADNDVPQRTVVYSPDFSKRTDYRRRTGGFVSAVRIAGPHCSPCMRALRTCRRCEKIFSSGGVVMKKVRSEELRAALNAARASATSDSLVYRSDAHGGGDDGESRAYQR